MPHGQRVDPEPPRYPRYHKRADFSPIGLHEHGECHSGGEQPERHVSTGRRQFSRTRQPPEKCGNVKDQPHQHPRCQRREHRPQLPRKSLHRRTPPSPLAVGLMLDRPSATAARHWGISWQPKQPASTGAPRPPIPQVREPPSPSRLARPRSVPAPRGS